jgi:hypothetical protein
MSIIPEMNIKNFQKLRGEDIKKLESVVLTDGEGNYLATFIVPQTDFIKMKVEYIGEMSNWVRLKGIVSSG